jgi:glycosyltransferase involved in cell wall biosynthesis
LEKNFDFYDPDLLDDSFRVVYLGSIRLVNNIQLLIDAAAHLKSFSHIKFLIYGDGEDRSSMEDYVKSKSITNIKFKQKWINPEYVPFLLSKSSLNILNYRPNSVEKYGGSQSKLFQYLASGKPICSNLQYGNSLITQFNLGISKSFSSSEEYAEAILSISRMGENEFRRISLESRKLAEKFDYQSHTKELMKLF